MYIPEYQFHNSNLHVSCFDSLWLSYLDCYTKDFPGKRNNESQEKIGLVRLNMPPAFVFFNPVQLRPNKVSIYMHHCLMFFN